MGRGRFAQWFGAALVVACSSSACAPQTSSEKTERSASAASPAPGIPCTARANAVTANTANVFSNSGSLVDSYQSSLGSYGGTNIGSNGNVQAAQAIVHNGGVIHGTQTPNTPAGLAVVPVPSGATNLPLGSKTPGILNINTAGQGITLAPGTYVVENLTVDSPGSISISPAGQVLVWVTGTLNLGGKENLNGAPENLEFLVTSSSVTNVNVGGVLSGFVYAPLSVVNVDSTFFGGTVGTTVNLNLNAALHFDQSSVCPTADAGSDAATDAPADAAKEASVDASDASRDASADVVADIGAEAARDASADVSADVSADASVDVGVDAPTCTAALCNTNNPCSLDTCNPDGTCSHTPLSGTTCSTGNLCFANGVCASGTCTGTNPVTCAASDTCHVAGTCNPSTGACSNPTAANGTSCSDGNACTQSDTCQAGVCTGTNPVTCAASDTCHVAGTCNPSTGACSNPTAANGTSCSDGNACTQSDTCQAGVCTGTNLVTCAASDTCHVAGTCNPSTGACSNPTAANGTSCSDGNACTQSDTCQAGVCTGTNPVTCAASDTCHVAGTCNPSTGACSNPTAANGTSCSDGNACTQSDTCQAGVCTGTNLVTCAASDTCHVAGTCNPSTGACSNPTAANGTSCSDGNACTQSDTCQAGVCTGTNLVTCAASDTCHVAGTCNPSTGACSNPTAANGTSCSDGNACTQTDTCQAGACVGGPPLTCAADACHVAGICDPATGCSSAPLPDGTPCTGADKCNQVYECAAGACTGASPVTCTASDQCHAPGTCDPASGSCSNPVAADGTSCNDGNACTQSDSCRSGTCIGSSPVSCAALDVCHSAGTCNPATGTCSNPNAPDGKSCGTTDASQGQVCTGGACGASTPCTPNQTMCAGLCANTQSDVNNCGACGQACTAGFSCIVGACVPPAIAASCLPASSLAVLAGPDGVTAYLPNGSYAWPGTSANEVTGVQLIALEGTAQPVTIPTPQVVNACSSNWVTGETVCTTNGTDVYLIKGATLTATLTSGATGTQLFFGSIPCNTCGVAIDSSTNRAIIPLGLAADPSLTRLGATGGFQFLDLTTNTFDTPISAGLPVELGEEEFTSEDIAIDPFRHLVISPNEFGNFKVLQTGASPTIFNWQFGDAETEAPVFDSSAEDCSTGIALAPNEASAALTLVDLTQAVFTPGSPSGTWSAPTSTLPMLELTPASDHSDMTGLAVAPGSHLGLLTPEFGGARFGVFRLPSTSGSGVPAIVDWAAVPIPNEPSGAVWLAGTDPHTVTAYTSPTTNRAMGLMADNTGYGSPTFTALIDLQAALDAPRLPGSHTVDPTYDLVGHGVIKFITAPCERAKVFTDPVNCGACGNVCPAEANSTPTCVRSTCGLACAPGYADCNTVATDGCEINLLADPSNCGTCGTNCAAPNGAGVCSAGHCAVACNAGFSDCDGIASNGCETAGPCGAPVVSVTGPTSAAAGDTPTYVATASDPVPGRTLSFVWTTLSGPAAVTFSAPSALTTTADFSAPGAYVLQFAASDGFATTAASLPVNVVLVNQPPVVTVGADQTLTAPAMTAILSATATDDGLPQGAALSSTWSLVSGPVVVTFDSPTQSGLPEPGPISASTGVTFSYPGTYVFQLAVSDGDLVGVGTETVTVNPPPAATGGTGGTTGGGGTGTTTGGGTGTTPSAPTVAIGGVTDDQEVTQPTQILGTVSDGSWVLEWRLGGRDDVQTAWAVMASGTGAVNGSTIATFDPTLLLNGIYTLRLSSENSVGSSSTSVSLSVNARMKVGFFTLTFTDLNAAVGGLPLTVTRTYDSRDKTVGDFGVGWKLGIADVRVEKSGKTGAFWNQQFIDEDLFSEFCLSPSQAASVAITFPSGRQYRFVPQSSPQCTAEFENTAPDIVWVSTSDPNNPTIQLSAAGQTSVFANDVGNGVTELQDDNFDIWDPRQFTLTIEDGSVWQIDEDLGVTAVRDRNGNTLTITPNGIVHSSGERVTFARDTQGRITTITDPNGASMTYAYDGNGDLATYADRLSNVTQFSYEANHYLDQIRDPLGRMPVRNDYDPSGRLLSTTDAAGNTVHYTPNLAANQEQVADRLGHVTLYTYDDRGDVTQKVDATGAVWNYTFDIRGNKLTETDPLGHTTTSTYDGADDLLTQTDALGNVTTNAYNIYKELQTTTDPLGHTTTNAYDGSGNLAITTDPLGNAKRYTYDAQGNRLTETDALFNVSSYTYDVSGHVTQMTDGSGQTTSYTYDANGNKTSESAERTDSTGGGALAVTHFQYDALGHLTQTAGEFLCQAVSTCPAVRSTAYTATGKRASDTDELGRVTTYTYDALDRLVTTTRPDGTTTTQAYDAESHRTSSTDAAGSTTNYAYDPLGRVVRTTFADGAATSTTYDAAGNAVQNVDELGHVRWTAYDAATRHISTTDAVGAMTQYAYDGAGNQVSVVDALGHTTTFAYDAANRAMATTYADGTADSTRYDASGRVIAKIDTLGRVTAYGYDAVGRLLNVKDALGQVTQYTYNGFGERLSQTDANGNTTKFTIDVFSGRETGRVLPDGFTENRLYDGAGEVVQRTDFARRTTSYTYDAMGRELSRTYPDNTGVAFTYTPDGRRATETDARGTTSYAYDTRRRPVQMTYPDGRVLTYGYDAHGDRTSLTAKIGSQSWTTTTAYDADERPNQVKDPLGRTFALSYDANGNRTGITYPNATSTTYAYDPLRRLTNLATAQTTAGSSPVPIQSYAYTLDAAGRRTRVAEADGTVRAYGYDGIDRLISEAVTGPLTYTKTFAYDAVGNRMTQTTTGAGADIDSYAYDTRDRLTSESDGATSYAYDLNGNVTSKSGEASYSWDFENRLTSVGMASGTSVAHEYDPDGNRVQTSVTSSASAATTKLLVDTIGCASCGSGLSQAATDTDANGNLTALYIRAGDELLEVMRPGLSAGTWSTRFVHSDGLRSVRALTDETGMTIDTRAYEAFGTKNVEAGSDPLTYGFAGEPFQLDSMLAYHRARWMDARVGRFEGMDPEDGYTKRPATLQRYVYATNNSANLTDPSGRDPDMVSVTASIEIVGEEATAAVPSEAAAGEAIVGEAIVNSAVAELTTALSATDLGLSEGAFQIAGKVLQSGTVKVITVDFVGSLGTSSVFQAVAQFRTAVQTMLAAAEAAGITTLQIQATFANAPLAAAVEGLVTQAGGTFASVGGVETITFILP